jgi:hypothetical protein
VPFHLSALPGPAAQGQSIDKGRQTKNCSSLALYLALYLGLYPALYPALSLALSDTFLETVAPCGTSIAGEATLGRIIRYDNR